MRAACFSRSSVDESPSASLIVNGTSDQYGRSIAGSVPDTVLKEMQVRKIEIEKELALLDGDVPSFGNAIRSLRAEASAADAKLAAETLHTLLSNILKIQRILASGEFVP